MPEFKTISQRNFLKGLQATFGLFSQPSGILTRVSNLVYDKRGSGRTTDGSLVFTQRNGQVQQGDGPLIDVALYSPPGANAYYVGIQKGFAQQQAPVSAILGNAIQLGGNIASIVRANGVVTLTTTGSHHLETVLGARTPFVQGSLVIAGVSDASFDATVPVNQITFLSATAISYPQAGANNNLGAGGTLGTPLAPGTYSYDVTSLDGTGGETPASGAPVTVNVVAPNNAVALTWTPGAGDANLYSVYATAGTGGRVGRLNPGPGETQSIVGAAYQDFGLLSNPGLAPPAGNTTQTCQVYRMDAPSYTAILATLPTYFFPITGGIPGAIGGAQSTQSQTAGAGPSAVGGVIGSLSPLPQTAQFTGRLVFALGNGFAPQQFTDPTIDATGFAPIANNFQATFPDWQPSVAWSAGDQIKDSVSGAIFQATQGGVSGAARPAFHNQLKAVTADNTVVWTCTATGFQGSPLRGAAHAIVYAGSLWLANTWPVTTADQLDGPNCIKMSDVNNVSSWNPINVGFIARDDGDQIMGLATFTIAESGIAPTGSLVVFKNFTTYQITGVFGASDFSIQQAQTDMGCIAPRSILFAPGFGIMRMTHLGVAYFNGVADKLISEEIRPYIFGGQADIQPIDWNYIYFAKAAQAANPPMYVLAVPIQANPLPGVTVTAGTAPGASPVTVYVRVSQVISNGSGGFTETNITPEMAIVSGDYSAFVTTPNATGVQYRVYIGLASNSQNKYTQFAAFNNTRVQYATSVAGAPTIGNGSLQRLCCYDLVMKAWAIIDLPFPISALKQVRSPGTIPLTVAGGFSDGQLRRLFAGDLTWDTGQQVNWSMEPPEVFQQGGSGKVFFRRLVIRGQETINASISVAVMLGGRLPPAKVAQKANLGTNQWIFTVDILQDALNANAHISGSGPISIDSVDWQVKPKSTGAPVSVQK